ncbi:hypothetical protein FPOAC2_10894 [Fusarium poae]|uniref:DUF202 domain-containing protein n=2 Tax=Fusarium poae TaxID=36050 RepID=A0A1B8ACA2_FUSPO|nr:hypothetical protein FPOA_09834 [Fusarium poae]
MAETAPKADANTHNNAPARSPSVGFNLGRYSSSNTRINEILENARERAESMSMAPTASPNNPSPIPAGSPILPPNSALKSNPGNEDSSADEATGFISHTPPLNYNSLNVTSAAASGPRARRTSTRSSRQIPSSLGNRNGGIPNPQTNQQDEIEDESQSWWKAQAEKFHSIELENKGSVARDHLAIERTFLAWLRTSLSFASIGIAVTQLFRLNTSLESGNHGDKISDRNAATLRHMGKPLGTTFLGISILVLFLGYKRYFQSQHYVIKGKFPASRGTIMIVAFVALAIMIASLVVVIAIQPSVHEL